MTTYVEKNLVILQMGSRGFLVNTSRIQIMETWAMLIPEFRQVRKGNPSGGATTCNSPPLRLGV